VLARKLLICDRDRKWSAAVERFLVTAGARMIPIPFLAPNCSAHAERFARSIKEECLDGMIPSVNGTCGERSPNSWRTIIANATTRDWATS
jgi:hypothetical protein